MNNEGVFYENIRVLRDWLLKFVESEKEWKKG